MEPNMSRAEIRKEARNGAAHMLNALLENASPASFWGDVMVGGPNGEILKEEIGKIVAQLLK